MSRNNVILGNVGYLLIFDFMVGYKGIVDNINIKVWVIGELVKENGVFD